VDDSPWGLPPHLTSPRCAVQSGSTPPLGTSVTIAVHQRMDGRLIAEASRTTARTKHTPTETAWAISSASNSGLSVEIVMSLVYTRPGGA
jgi:hypothetical protein